MRKSIRLITLPLLQVLATLCLIGSAQAVTINDYVIPTPGSNPFQIIAGPDGNLWFTEAGGAKLGRITTNGVITEFPLPNPFSGVLGITAGPDGNLWFVVNLPGNHRVARMTTSGVITEFPLPNPADSPYSLIAGKDALWYLVAGRKVGKITTGGMITEYPLPVGSLNAIPELTTDAEGNILFLQLRSQNPSLPAEYWLGKLTPNGNFSEVSLGLLRSYYITDLGLGPDGNLWYSTISGPNALGDETQNGLRKLDLTGTAPLFIPTQSLAPIKFITGPGGHFWFLANVGAETNRIGRATLGGAVTQYEAGGLTHFTDLTGGADGNLWLLDPTRNVVSKLGPDRAGELVLARATSFVGGALAPDSIAVLFGNALATTTASATTTPLPTNLGGISVKLRDKQGTEHNAPLFFVSPSQINLLVPAETLPGNAVVTVIGSAGQTLATGTLIVDTVAPGLFSAAATGRGPAAALVLRVKADGSQSYEPTTQFDPVQNRFSTIPIDLGPDLGDASDQVFLVLFGSGIRRHDNLETIRALLSGGLLPVIYAGAQGSLPGLDQVNLRLPRNLTVRGEQDVILTIGGRAANKVRINIK
jgi:uncharacterized protein (TIGR03437 family)